jgi:hypothetical protein
MVYSVALFGLIVLNPIYLYYPAGSYLVFWLAIGTLLWSGVLWHLWLASHQQEATQ